MVKKENKTILIVILVVMLFFILFFDELTGLSVFNRKTNCNDPDMEDVTKQGELTIIIAGKTKTFRDSCENGATVREWVCTHSGRNERRSITCPEKYPLCVGGACINRNVK